MGAINVILFRFDEMPEHFRGTEELPARENQ